MCVNIYRAIVTETYVHTYVHTYIDTCMHAYIHTFIYTYTYMHTHTHTHTPCTGHRSPAAARAARRPGRDGHGLSVLCCLQDGRDQCPSLPIPPTSLVPPTRPIHLYVIELQACAAAGRSSWVHRGWICRGAGGGYREREGGRERESAHARALCKEQHAHVHVYMDVILGRLMHGML